jgi:hypothetical protein
LDAQGCKIQGTEATRGIYVANYNPVVFRGSIPQSPCAVWEFPSRLRASTVRATRPLPLLLESQVRATENPIKKGKSTKVQGKIRKINKDKCIEKLIISIKSKITI